MAIKQRKFKRYGEKDEQQSTGRQFKRYGQRESKPDLFGLDFVQSGKGNVGQNLLGTVGDAALNFGKGIGAIGEGLDDLSMYGMAWLSGIMGDQKMADEYKAYAQRNTVEDALKPLDDYVEDYSYLGETSDAVFQALGNYGTMVATGNLGAAAGLGKAGVSVLTNAVTGLSSMGSGMSEAYQQGATDGEALKYGAAAGAIDAASELVFGGLGKAVDALGFSRGLVSFDDALAKTLSKGFKHQLTKNMVEYAIKSGFEGLEEIMAEHGKAIAKKMTYMSDEELSDLVHDTGTLETFLTSTLTSAISQGGDLVRATKGKTDFITGYTRNEQAVIDAEVKKRVAAEQKETGEKLSNKAVGKIQEQVEKDLNRGFISIDTIEEAIGGDAYKAYRAEEDRKEQNVKKLELFQKEYDELNGMKLGEMTGQQTDRKAELKEMLPELKKKVEADKASTKASDLKKTLTDNVAKLAQGDRLWESYNERERRKATFAADLTGMSEKKAAVYQKAIDSGLLNNTNRTHDYVELAARVAEDKGLEVEFVGDDSPVAGKLDSGKMTLNIKAMDWLNKVVGHEVTHVLERGGGYGKLDSLMVQYAREKGEYDSRMESIRARYEGVYSGEDFDAMCQKELTAELVGDYLFTDEAFVKRLLQDDRSTFRKIWDEIKYFLKTVSPGSKEEKQLAKVQRAFEQAYKANSQALGNADDGAQYSIGETTDGRLVAVVDSDILSSIDTGSWDNAKKAEAKKAAADALKQFQDGISVNGITRKVNRTSRREYTGSQYTEALYRKDKQAFADKMRAAEVADDIVVAATNWQRDGGIKHKRSDNIADFDHGTILIVSGANKYTAEVLVGITDRGDAVFYDVVDMKPESFDIKETESPTTATTQNTIGDILGDSAENIISNPSENVKQEFSIAPPSPYAGPGQWLITGEDVRYDPEYQVPWDIGPVREDLAPTAAEGDKAPAKEEVDPLVAEEDEEIAAMEERVAELETEMADARGIEDYNTYYQKKAERDAIKAQLEANNPTNAAVQALEAELADKNTFISKAAKALLDEISNPQKGVRFSKTASSLVDQAKAQGLGYHEVEFALYNAKNQPDGIVDQRAPMEPIVREALEDQYNARAYELAALRKQIEEKKFSGFDGQSVSDRKIRETEIELAILRRQQEENWTELNAVIGDLQAKYDAKRNKSTMDAKELKWRIEGLKNVCDNVDSDIQRRIERAQEKLEKLNSPEYQRAIQRRVKQEQIDGEMAALIGDTTYWRDHRYGFQNATQTMRRILRDVVRKPDGKRDIQKADAIYDALQGRYNENEAELKRESRRLKQAYAEMEINRYEDVYIQMLGEFRHNPDSTITPQIVEEYLAAHKDKIDEAKVDKAIEMARETYDALYERVNAVLREHGMKELEYRKGYFPHFTEEKQGFLAKLLNWKVQKTDIPTSIAGMTEEFKPKKSWQSFDKQRTGDITDYSFTKGLDTYMHGALDWIYHIEDIQRRRSFENHIRYVHSDEGVKARINELKKSEQYDADELQEQIDLVLGEANNPLNNFVTDLRTGTNALAGKKSSMDRGVEAMFNREIYSTMTNISNRVSANQVVASISSAMTNFIPITQSWGEVSPRSSLKAMYDTIKAGIRDDGVIQKSTFLTNRLAGEENLYKTRWDKISEKAGWLMEAVDGFTSQTVWRSKYMENIAAGMSENEAIKNADQFAENVIGGRSRGNMPTIFNSKNPLIKVMTAFQLEVANQYGYLFKDLPQDVKENRVARLAKGYAGIFVGAFAYNALYSSLTGRNAAFDPIRIIQSLLGDLFDDEDEDEWYDNLVDFGEDVLEEVPFVGGLLGGGRIPISSAMPYGEGVWDVVTNTVSDLSKLDEGGWERLTKEWLNPVLYVGLPMGGGQLKKTVQGLSMFDDDRPVSGSYTDTGNLRFPVEDTLGNRIQAGLFGQWANENAQEYLNEGWAPIDLKRTYEYMASGLEIGDYRKIRTDLSRIESDKDKDGNTVSGSRKEKVLGYIDSLDIEPIAKMILFKGQFKGDDTYNREIVEYLNGREDLEYEQLVGILEYLGFTVKDRYVTWD